MKYFTALLVSAVTSVFLGGTVAADAARFWRVQISEPTTQTTSKTLRINYNVQSTFDDTFTVRLFENGGIRSTEAVNNPGGDSGKFVVSIPATGTYNYFVRATNNQAGESKNSRVVTVEVVNEPEATTVTVVQQPAGGQGAGGAGGDGAVVAAAGDAGGAQADGAGDGQVLSLIHI